MSDIFDKLIIVILFVSAYSLLISILNLFSFQRPKPLSPKNNSKVSILIPCRNEETNITECVESLIVQDYENLEILLIDDNSTDNTWNQLKNLAAKFPQVSAFKGTPLPDNWAGKNWACHQLGQKAKGDFFLFIDADTNLAKYSVSSALKHIEDNNLEFITLVPKRKIFNITDYFIWIMVSWFIFSWIPFYLAKKLPFSLFAAGFGQFLFFNKEAYLKIGGHKKISNLVLDDFELARTIKSQGFNSDMLDGTHLIETKGYTSSIDAVDGHAKSIFATFRYNILVFLFAFFGLILLFYVPWLNLISYFFNIELSAHHILISFLSIIFIFLSSLISSKAFSLSIFSSFLYPIAMLVLLFSGYRSFLSSFDGDIKWKGRSTPSTGVKKLYTLIFFPFLVLNWFYRKLRS
ncbi:glycosyltransferase [Chloroflexi bacterium]|nr:hypothetical protein [Chloroflexota bacterium]MDC0252850.1 glycosyltransferase [Chloroflexota bacterium]OUW96239.1 MAG: hypothetical protein CBD90_01080 [Chloroflexi bacterium TMED230]RZP14382.1 MAG: glycosyltransferase [Chloroflexota bacterium]